jgi:hypothetical protein
MNIDEHHDPRLSGDATRPDEPDGFAHARERERLPKRKEAYSPPAYIFTSW